VSGVKTIAVLAVASGAVAAMRYLRWLPGSRTRASLALCRGSVAGPIAGPAPDNAAGRPPALTLAWVGALAPDPSR
jgi:hypothetical protein